MSTVSQKKFLSGVAERVGGIRRETQNIRDGIFKRNRASSEDSRLFAEENGLRLVYKIGAYSRVGEEYDGIKKRRIDCAIYDGDEKIVAADFIEIKTYGEETDYDFFWTLDEPNSHFANIALAYLSGWDASELHENDGTLTVLDHLASSSAAKRSEWTPLFNKFVDEKVLSNSMVMLVDPFPHDVVNVIDQGTVDEDMENRARKRHEAKFAFAEQYLGFTKFGPEARSNHWMYRLNSKKYEFEPRFMNFNTRDLKDLEMGMRWQMDLCDMNSL